MVKSSSKLKIYDRLNLYKMSHEKQRIESMLFDYGTTYRTTYKGGPIPDQVTTEYKEKPKPSTVRPPIVKDTHTLTAWKSKIPFYLQHKPKEVVRTNPYAVLQTGGQMPEIVDTDRERVQKTRPRLVLTPAVSMDDIEDSHARVILCKDMYTTDTAKGLEEAVTTRKKVQAPFPKHPAPANPIVLPKLQPPRVPPEWRMESASWDGKQLRSFCDPTRDFWLNREVPECRACAESAVMRYHRKMLSQRKV